MFSGLYIKNFKNVHIRIIKHDFKHFKLSSPITILTEFSFIKFQGIQCQMQFGEGLSKT